MDPKKIRALLVERGIKITTIARDLGITQPSVSLVISRNSRSYRVEKEISDRLGKPYERLWGSEPRRRAA